MKVIQSSLFRSVSAILVGVLVIKYREQAVTWITICIGVLFFLSGVISCATYYGNRKNTDKTEVYDAEGNLLTPFRPSFPIVGLGSLVLGAILALMPNTFINGLMYILSIILILGALNQFVLLASAIKYRRIGFYFWIVPSVILFIGIIAIVYPSAIASAPLLVIGWSMVVYGVTECLNALKLRSINHACQNVANSPHSNPSASEEIKQPQEETLPS